MHTDIQVYKARRPFHPKRLYNNFLNGIFKYKDDGNKNDSSKDILILQKKSILRSKGFFWLASSCDAAYFLSYAGKTLDVQVII